MLGGRPHGSSAELQDYITLCQHPCFCFYGPLKITSPVHSPSGPPQSWFSRIAQFPLKINLLSIYFSGTKSYSMKSPENLMHLLLMLFLVSLKSFTIWLWLPAPIQLFAFRSTALGWGKQDSPVVSLHFGHQ